MSENILSRSQSSKSLDCIKPKNDDCEGPYDSRKTNFSEGSENDASENSESQKDVSQFLYSLTISTVVQQQVVDEILERLKQVEKENRETKYELDKLKKQKQVEHGKMQSRTNVLEKENYELKNGSDESRKQEKKVVEKEIVEDSNTNKLISKLTNMKCTREEVGNAIVEFISEKNKKLRSQSSLAPQVSEKIYGILADVAGMYKWYYKGFAKDEFKKIGCDLNTKNGLLKHVLEEFCIRFREYNSASEDSKEVEKKIRNVAKMLSAISLIDENLAKSILSEVDNKVRRDMLGTGELTGALILHQIRMDKEGLDKIIGEFKRFHEESTNRAKSFKEFYYCEFINGSKKIEPWMLYYFLFAFETKNKELQKLDGFNEASLPSVRFAVFLYYAAKFIPNIIVGISITSFGVKFFLEPLINNSLVKNSWKATLVNGLVSTFASVLIKVLLVWIEKNFIKSQKRHFLAKLQEKAAKNAKTSKEAKEKAKTIEDNKASQNEVKHADNNNVASVEVQNNQQNAQRSYSVCLSLDKKAKPVSTNEVHKQTGSIRFIYSKEKEMEQGKKLGQVFERFMKENKGKTTEENKPTNHCNETNSGVFFQRSSSFGGSREVLCEA